MSYELHRDELGQAVAVCTQGAQSCGAPLDISVDSLITWRASQGDNAARANLGKPCNHSSDQRCVTHAFLRSRIRQIVTATRSRGYDGWFVSCPPQQTYPLPDCVHPSDLADLPLVGQIHSVWNKHDSVLVTYTSGLHVWHLRHQDLPLSVTAAPAEIEARDLPLAEANGERVLLAAEVRRALDFNTPIRYDRIWRHPPRTEKEAYKTAAERKPVFPCFTTKYVSAYHTVLASAGRDERDSEAVRAVRTEWQGGGIGRSRTMPLPIQQGLLASHYSGSANAREINVVEHGITYTHVCLPMRADAICHALGVSLGLTAFTDDHELDGICSPSGLLAYVIDTLRDGLASGARHCFDAVIGCAQVNELMIELHHQGIVAHRPDSVESWFDYALTRSVMFAIHPITELAASLGDRPVAPHHYALADMGATIAHDLCDLRYDVSNGMCLNSIYALETALGDDSCAECVAECLIPMITHCLLSENTEEYAILAALVAGCGFLRPYCFGHSRALLNARATILDDRCPNAWYDAIRVLERCAPEISTTHLRSSDFTTVCQEIRDRTQLIIDEAAHGDALIHEATRAAVSDTSSAQEVETLWKACIEDASTALLEYADGDPRHLAALVWSAMAHSSPNRINMRCGSIRHTTDNADRVPGWQSVLSSHTKVPM
ncbi:hypothetical protein [Nocardia pseudobrasiliensis]|uniref:Uncharacterized protein n=1 Tax=Nocardia pseudobrasiliensis TaxID=45979 RepID=A0A370HLC7_9NOCA|nr:hypothetical protein [Nocardia pseudobrasiliensis]RDI58965.1 hypothetical protein DFR76_1234 [Nocardia pseudobrasiliensis]